MVLFQIFALVKPNMSTLNCHVFHPNNKIYEEKCPYDCFTITNIISDDILMYETTTYCYLFYHSVYFLKFLVYVVHGISATTASSTSWFLFASLYDATALTMHATCTWHKYRYIILNTNCDINLHVVCKYTLICGSIYIYTLLLPEVIWMWSVKQQPWVVELPYLSNHMDCPIGHKILDRTMYIILSLRGKLC